MDKYRSLDAWKRAHAMTLLALRVTDATYHPRARSLFDQLRRAAISVGANIVEGYALGTPAQFLRHLRIALGSAAEAEYLGQIGRELGYFDEESGKQLSEAIGGTLTSLYGLLKHLSRKRHS